MGRIATNHRLAMDSQIHTQSARTKLTLADFDRIAENLAMTPPPFQRITSKDFVMAKKAELLKRIADGHTATSLAAAMKAQGVPPITPRRLGELLELPRRRKNKSATKRRSASDV